MTKFCIAVDAMGGDHGLSVTVPAALQVLTERSDLAIILVGDQVSVQKAIENYPGSYPQSRLSIQHASQVVGMDEQPSYALRGKKDSSMRIALNCVQAGRAQACVSAGNTGALMAIARFVLKMLPGIDRPAILFPLPSLKGAVNMLDLGANVECQANHLCQFAIMGSILIAAISNNPNPTVGLLNVGSEAIKGTEQVKRAAHALSQSQQINYKGFVEGDDIFKGTVDVVVCDGFVGNVALKASEGLAKMMLAFAREEFARSPMTKLAALLAKRVLQKVFTRFDPNNYNGGSLLGLQGVVVKSHGGASQQAFATALHTAVKAVEMDIPTKIKQNIAAQLGDFSFP